MPSHLVGKNDKGLNLKIKIREGLINPGLKIPACSFELTLNGLVLDSRGRAKCCRTIGKEKTGAVILIVALGALLSGMGYLLNI